MIRMAFVAGIVAIRDMRLHHGSRPVNAQTALAVLGPKAMGTVRIRERMSVAVSRVLLACRMATVIRLTGIAGQSAQTDPQQGQSCRDDQGCSSDDACGDDYYGYDHDFPRSEHPAGE